MKIQLGLRLGRGGLLLAGAGRFEIGACDAKVRFREIEVCRREQTLVGERSRALVTALEVCDLRLSAFDVRARYGMIGARLC